MRTVDERREEKARRKRKGEGERRGGEDDEEGEEGRRAGRGEDERRRERGEGERRKRRGGKGAVARTLQCAGAEPQVPNAGGEERGTGRAASEEELPRLALCIQGKWGSVEPCRMNVQIGS